MPLAIAIGDVHMDGAAPQTGQLGCRNLRQAEMRDVDVGLNGGVADIVEKPHHGLDTVDQ